MVFSIWLAGFPRHQPAYQVLKTICSNIRSSAPEDGHDAETC